MLQIVYCVVFISFSWESRYFPKEATQEVLDEIFPKLFPLDTGKICGAFDLLSIFLNPLQGYDLWLTDFINLWNTYHNPSWNVVRKVIIFDVKTGFNSNAFLVNSRI